MKNIKNFIPEILEIAKKAGQETVNIYNSADFGVTQKDDCSPVTKADIASHNIIVAGLEKITPDIPIVSEEDSSSWEIVDDIFWLIDPLDGTKEFINKRDEFTINIALIKNKHPVFGVVYAPVIDEMYWNDGDKAFLNGDEIKAGNPPEDGLIVMASRSHSNKKELDDYLKDYNVKELIFAGSSLKICKVASGEADMYPRLAPTMIWDTAAAHAVLLAAGGTIETLENKPLSYEVKNLKNPFFVCKGNIAI